MPDVTTSTTMTRRMFGPDFDGDDGYVRYSTSWCSLPRSHLSKGIKEQVEYMLETDTYEFVVTPCPT